MAFALQTSAMATTADLDESFRKDALAMQVPLHQPPPSLPNYPHIQPDIDSETTYLDINDLDAQQRALEDYMLRGISCCFIGAAGTGKTSAIVSIIVRMLPRLPAIGCHSPSYYKAHSCDPDHKHLLKGYPGFMVVSFTNRAVGNLANQMPTIEYRYKEYDSSNGEWIEVVSEVNLQRNCITAHKALEYTPVPVEKIDPATGETYVVRDFLPQRSETNQIPPDVRIIFVEESSMVKIELFDELRRACPNAIFVFMGDMNQLLPVAGYPILGAALTRLPVIELTHIYRHGGAIQDLAHMVRRGETKYLPHKPEGYVTQTPESTVINYTYKQDLAPASEAAAAVSSMLYKFFTIGVFCPGVDLVMIPQYPSGDNMFGIEEIAADFYCRLDEFYRRPTYYVRASSGPVLVGIGDVLYSDKYKREFLVLGVTKNGRYKGTVYPPMNYKTRDPDTWLSIYDARSSDNAVAAEMMEKEIGIDLRRMDSSELMASIDFHDNVKHRNRANKGDESVGRQATHELILLDLDLLPGAIRANGYKDNIFTVQEQFLRSMIHEALTQDHGIRELGLNMSAEQRLESFKLVASKFGLDDYYSKNVSSTRSSDDLGGLMYAFITVHKAQGLQGRRVIFAAHPSNSVYRELIYTAVTRAVDTLITISHGQMFGPNPAMNEKLSGGGGVRHQRIRGVSLDEKIKSFVGMISAAAVNASKKGRSSVDLDEMFALTLSRNEQQQAKTEAYNYMEIE